METIIVKCPKCGTKNRIFTSCIDARPVCGKCKEPLTPIPAYDHPIDITDQTFTNEIIQYRGTVLLDCWAPWCGPCKAVASVLEQLAKEYAGRVKIAKLNTDQNPQTASRFNIRSIPTMILFKNGNVVDTLVGALPKTEIEKHLTGAIG